MGAHGRHGHCLNLHRDMHIVLHTLMSLCRVVTLLLFRGIVDYEEVLNNGTGFAIVLNDCGGFLTMQCEKKIMKKRVSCFLLVFLALPYHGLGFLLHFAPTQS